MSFNLGGWNRLPFNRGSIEEIRLEVIFDSGLGMEGDDIIVDDALSIAFDSSLDMEADVLLVRNLTVDFNASLDLSVGAIKAVYETLTLDASMDIPEDMTKVLHWEIEFGAGLDMDGEWFSGELEQFELAIVLYPGDIVVIDSCTYTVTLNGKNIYHLRSGDWVFLREGSEELLVDSDQAGQLEVKTDYAPKYP